MNLYVDTSALVPLLVTEASSARCRQLWNAADLAICTAIGHVEASAALARAHRAGHLPPAAVAHAVQLLDGLWSDIAVVPADGPRLRAASAAALRHGLRGYDAVHCACAERIDAPDLVVASGDKDVLAACVELALTTALTGQ